jgi:ligand-binding sensor domain-containing protein
MNFTTMKSRNLKGVSFFLFTQFILITSLWAQNPNFNFSCLSTRDGLSNNFVNDVIEDSRGFLWIATTDGLNRYNGYNCEIFKYEKNNTNSLPSNFILTLADDKSDNIWVGTNQSGLAR